jgi:endogenous inhibitor of DNA gyrase (YacG/DUF329 family)
MSKTEWTSPSSDPSNAGAPEDLLTDPLFRLVHFDDHHPNCPACGKSMIEEPIASDTRSLDGPRALRWISIMSMTNDADNLVECPDCAKQFPAMIKVPLASLY